MSIEDEINKLTLDKFGFRIKKAVLNSEHTSCDVEIFYKDGSILSQDERQSVENKLTEILPSGFKYTYKFVKNFVVNEAVKDFLVKYFRNNFPAIDIKVSSVDCENNENKKVVLTINDDEKDYAINRNIKEKVESELYNNFFTNINAEFVTAEPEIISEDADVLPFFDEPQQRFIEVKDVEPIVGNLTDTMASYIADKNTISEEVCFAGTIYYIKECQYEAKRKKTNEEEAKKEKTEGDEPKSSIRKYFKFGIESFSSKINCVIFTSSATYEPMLKLAKGDSVIFSGILEEDKFSGGASVKVSKISKCTLPEIKEEEIVFKPEPESYRYIVPEKLEYYSQVDLFGSGEKLVNEFFLSHDVVVFDFETTGLKLDGTDKIIEIGAVKLKKGKIEEQFSTLINPQMKIPPDSTKKHGIKDQDVLDKPTYEQVLPDFYKFTRNCVLAGYNIINFDMIFLNYFGKKCRYNFDNEVLDVYTLALKEVKGVKNYKLGTIAEKLGVTLDNAHRAVFDTIATAEVMLKLTEQGEKIEI